MRLGAKYQILGMRTRSFAPDRDATQEVVEVVKINCEAIRVSRFASLVTSRRLQSIIWTNQKERTHTCIIWQVILLPVGDYIPLRWGRRRHR